MPNPLTDSQRAELARRYANASAIPGAPAPSTDTEQEPTND